MNWRLWPCALAVAWTTPVPAQMLSYSRADSIAEPTGDKTLFSYRIGYLQKLHGQGWLSLDYVNEGHFDAHHRDGYALHYSWKLWSSRGFGNALFVSAGPYYYFDTQTRAGESRDVHGLAPSATAMFRHRVNAWFDIVASVDAVWPSNDFHAYTVGVGVAHWFGLPGEKPTSHGNPDTVEPADAGEPVGLLEPLREAAQSSDDLPSRVGPLPTELTFSAGLSTINMVSNPHGDGGSIEARWQLRNRLFHHYDLTLAYLNEGDPRVARRSGVTLQYWPVRSDPHWPVEVAAGFGAYVFVDRRRSTLTGQKPGVAVAPVISVMIASKPLWHGWFLRGIWDRVVTNYNRDADVWRLGVGRRIAD